MNLLSCNISKPIFGMFSNRSTKSSVLKFVGAMSQRLRAWLRPGPDTGLRARTV